MLFRTLTNLFGVEHTAAAWLAILPITVAEFLHRQGFVEQLVHAKQCRFAEGALEKVSLLVRWLTQRKIRTLGNDDVLRLGAC